MNEQAIEVSSGTNTLAYMSKHGKATLYFRCPVKKPNMTLIVPSDSITLEDFNLSHYFKVLRVTTGRHNFGLTRYDVWFDGKDGHIWHGVQYGDNAQILHCKRTKQTL